MFIFSSRFEEQCLRAAKPCIREKEEFRRSDQIRLRKCRGADKHLERDSKENWCPFLEIERFAWGEKKEGSWRLWEEYDQISW